MTDPLDAMTQAWDRPSDQEASRARPPNGQRNEPHDLPIATVEVHSAGHIDVTKIRPRGWLLGVTFCRKFISGLIGGGAVGKTAVRYIQYLAVATGKSLTCERVHRRGRVLIVCLEDNLEEVQRRIGAAMLYHEIDPKNVLEWLYYCTPKSLKLLHADARGSRVVGDLYVELQKLIRKLKIDLVSIDPFVKAHGIDENDNSAIDQVCCMLADLADEFDCAVDLISHARKGSFTPGDAESDRGASSKKDAGRLMRTLTPMSESQAEALSVPLADRRSFVRVDDGKVNLTADSLDAMWFRKIGVPLGNTDVDPDYPNGDVVHTVTRWIPPDFWGETTNATKNLVLDKIEAGPYPDGRYSPAPNAQKRAAWKVVQEFCPEISREQASQVISEWINTGVLIVKSHKDPENRSESPSLFVGKRPGDTWG
jgi:hypothetical protein